MAGSTPFRRLRQPRSLAARAILPVAGGIAVIAALFAATWVLASISTDRQRQVPRDRTFVVGKVDDVAASIDERGPILYPDLRDATGERSIVIDHAGDDPARGWQLYSAYPADRDWTCPVEQVEGTRTFTDCDGRTLDVTELALPVGARPIVENSTTLLVDLR